MDEQRSGARGWTHEPVLLNEVLEAFAPLRRGALIVDATVGLAGHATALLEADPGRRLIGIDRDPEALRLSGERLKAFGNRVTLTEGRHEELIDILDRLDVDLVDGVLADLGVSSLQLDDASRGFSFRHDAPLDMRMGRSGETAADLLARIDQSELEQILREFGEEPMARRIAAAIVREREVEPIETTGRLADVVRSVKPRRFNDRIDPATLTFQAVRIAVNEEIGQLADFVNAAVERLAPGGRLAVISFHSLEDRVIKRELRRLGGECTCPPRMPVCGCGAVAQVRPVRRKAIEAGDEEVRRNPRSRSAKLRVAERAGESKAP